MSNQKESSVKSSAEYEKVQIPWAKQLHYQIDLIAYISMQKGLFRKGFTCYRKTQNILFLRQSMLFLGCCVSAIAKGSNWFNSLVV